MMRLSIHRAGIWAAVLPVVCWIETTPAQPSYAPSNYSPTFVDEFDEFELDLEGDGSSAWGDHWFSWNVRNLDGNADKAWKCYEGYMGGGSAPLGEVLHEVSGDSTLKLYGKKTPPDKSANVYGMPFVGGMITTERSFSQQYGYFEVRCTFDLTKGHHWAVWLLSVNNVWPPEIDMMEVVGHQPDMVHMTAHWGPEHESNFQTFENVSTWEWHTYGLLWSQSEITWYLDGVQMKTMNNHFLHEPCYFLISPEIGGSWAGMPDSSTRWPTVCEIDFVKVYEDCGSPDCGVTGALGTLGQGRAAQGLRVECNTAYASPTIAYTVSIPQRVRIVVYDLRGAAVRTIVDECVQSGRHDVEWNGTGSNGRRLPTGVYGLKLVAQGGSSSAAATLVR